MAIPVRARSRSVSAQATQETAAIQLGAGPVNACVVTVANCAPVVHAY
jgi:hypothetical protein